MDSVKPLYDDKDHAHRFDHTERLYDFCVEVCEALGAEMDSLIPAAIVHGLQEGHEGRLRNALDETFETVLSLARSASSNPQTLEERIQWDANALGAVRLARAFTKGGHGGQDHR